MDSQRYQTALSTDVPTGDQDLTPLQARRVVSEPEMTPLEGIPGLNPPPAFQERFKYIVCSSGLLKERPNFGGRDRSRYDNVATPLEPSNARMTLAGLGIQDVSYEQADDQRIFAEPDTTGLRRRNNKSGEKELRTTPPPISFRRASSSSAATSVPSTPVFPSPSEYQSSGWRFLAYTPFIRTLSPYTEPIVLLLSSLLWMFQIVGWIWLEILAVGAIALCGFTTIIVKMSTEEKRSRSRTRSKKSRRPLGDSTKRDTSSCGPVEEAPIVQLEPTPNIATGEPSPTSIPNVNEHEQLDRAVSGDTVENEQSAISLPVMHLEEVDHTWPDTTEATSLQGLALETLQTVVQNAEEMDQVIGNALTVIAGSDR